MQFAVDIKVEEAGKNKPEYSIDTDLNGEVSLADFLDFTKLTLKLTALDILKEEQQLGFDKKPVTIVDGTPNKSIEQVSPLGSIEYVARADLNEVILETYRALLDKSKVDTGTYIRSHYVFLNGTQVANDLPSLTSWLASNPTFEQKDFIRFVNIQPYARKLERLGVTAQRSQQRSRKHKKGEGGTFKVPNGTYYLTARAIRSRYKRNSVIKFTFISGHDLGISGSFRNKKSGKPGRPYLYPTIVISVQENGIL